MTGGRTILIWLAVLFAAAAPASAQGDDPGLLRTIRAFGDATSGITIGGGAAADKVLYFGRNGAGELVVTGVAALAPGAPLGDVPSESLAVIRTRAAAADAPDPADVALARTSGIPIFIVGEWRSPPVIRELRRQGEAVAMREIDSMGTPGAWTALPR